MRFLWKKSEDTNKRLAGGKDLEPKFTPTIEIKSSNTKDGHIENRNIENSNDQTKEYEIVERVIYPEKIICPDCGGFTIEGLDFCDKCGGELYDMGDQYLK